MPRTPRHPALDDKRLVDFISVGDLRFDPENPRLPSTLDGTSDAAVLKWMVQDTTLLELMGSIGEQGYFPGEPLLVCPWDEQKGGPPWKVVEGNRRLAAVVLLTTPSRAPARKNSVAQISRDARHKPHELPVLTFAKRDDITDYLGYRHVTGIKEWDSLAKAKYLRQLWKKTRARGREGKFKELATRIGSRSDYVERLLSGLSVYDHIVESSFFGLRDVDEERIEFSVLTTALSYKSIAAFVGLSDKDGPAFEFNFEFNNRNLRDLIEWMYVDRPSGKPVVGESRQLRELAAVISKDEARKALKEGATLTDAVLLTEEPWRVFEEAILQARDRLKLAVGQLHKVATPHAGDFDILQEIVALARDLAALVEIRLHEAGQKD
jgi:hypothetical protein